MDISGIYHSDSFLSFALAPDNNSLLFRKDSGSNEKYLKGMTMEELEKIYFLCFESDRWVKTGKMEDRMSMEVLLAACGKVEKR